MPERDAELDELFSHPQDKEVVRLLRAARPATPPLDPNFRRALRAQLMAEARRTLVPQPRTGLFGRRAGIGPRRLFLGLTPMQGLAAAAAAFLVVLGFEAWSHQPSPSASTAIHVTSPENGKTNIAPDEIRLQFSQPVDQAAVEATIAIQPATQYTTRWEGQTLIVTPIHQLAANTNYSVTLRPVAAPEPAVQPSAVASPAPTPLPTPVIVHFVTAPSPPAPVTPPSFTSANLTFLGDSRLTGPGTFGTATWTADGQLLVTRPAERAGAKSSASPSASPSSATPTAKTMDLWVMSPRGNFIRRIATDVLDPAAAPSGGRVAYWHPLNSGFGLMVISAAGDGDAAQLAAVGSAPIAAPAWVGGDHVAYLDGGLFHVVDLQGNAAFSGTLVVTGAFAVSRDGTRLAAQTQNGIVVYELPSGQILTTLPDGASGLQWSSQDDLAYLLAVPASSPQASASPQPTANPQPTASPQPTGSELWVLRAGTTPAHKVAASQPGETWSNVNWSPDGVSLLFTSVTADNPGALAFVVDANGSAPPRQFGSRTYDWVDWSPDGRLVLFTRQDETGQEALWTATIQVGVLSAIDRAQEDALSTVKTFMDARLTGDQTAADSQLSATGRTAYQTAGLTLLSPSDPRFERWYPVTVQLINPDSFLIGVRIVEASGKTETSYFEENLTVTRHDQAFQIDAVQATPVISLAQAGPSVVAVQVRTEDKGQRVLVHFDSDLAASTVASTTILVRDSAGRAEPETVTYDQDTRTVTLQVRLKPGSYQLVVTTGLLDYKLASLSQAYTAPLVIAGGD